MERLTTKRRNRDGTGIAIKSIVTKEMPITDMGKSYNRALDFAISEIKAGGKV